ncbi:MAG: chromosomal replication initiator protein DnaA [Elusimicrobia bacterium]|nr:chromosomal replication initiator protein DnaA [Elusimicrobiota bacterium]
MSNNPVVESSFESGDTRLVPNYTFEEFVVGPHNRFPHAASLAVSENLGKAYNPLFLYGPVGIGKTHLMQAVGHRVLHRNPSARVLYVTAQQFMSEVIELLQAGKLQLLRERYRSLDLLLVDDIQFLATSEATQEEFFHMFNDLHASGKQIIMTSDRPPKMLTTLEDRLRSRFEWGLIADIKFTNLETRVAILKKKESHLKGFTLGDDVRLYIASRLKSNIRELEGFLRRIQAYTQLYNEEISLPLVKEILKELIPPEEWGSEETASGKETQAAPPPNDMEGFDLRPAGGSTAKENPPPAPPKPAVPVPVSPGPRPVEVPPPFVKVPPLNPPEPRRIMPAPVAEPETVVSRVPVTPTAVPVPVLQPVPAPSAPTLPKPPAAPTVIAPSVLPSNPGQIPVVFFYPAGRDKELVQMKKKFDDIIGKHKLKFSLHPALEVDYALSPTLDIGPFAEKCRQSGVQVGIVLGPPPGTPLQEAVFFGKLQESFEQSQMSLQMVPWDELGKDYRFLNLALDITLIRIKQKK